MFNGYTPPPIPIVHPPKKRTHWIILYFCAVGIAASVFAIGLAGTLRANQSHAQITYQPHQSRQIGLQPINISAATATDTPAPTTTPTDTPSPTPTSPPPTPTPTSAPTYHTCDANGCANPWGYVLGCSCGNMWQPVSVAPAGFCSWFQCAAGFDAEQGDIGECGDGQFVHNGDCAGHGGLLAYLYVNVPPTSTP